MIVGSVLVVVVVILVLRVHIAIVILYPTVLEFMGELSSVYHQSTIFFVIAGVTFRISFKPTEYPYERNLLENEIKRIYGANNRVPLSPVDWNIVISSSSVLYKKYHHLYFSYWYNIHGSTVATTYNIGPILFTHLISNLVRASIHKKSAFLLHSSAVIKNDKAFLFTGPSKIGKSTASNLLKNKLADDLVVVKRVGTSYDVYTDPYLEKDIIEKDLNGYKIGAVYFLKRLNTFSIEKIKDKSEVLQLLTSQLFTRKKYLKPQYKLLTRFVNNFDSFYYLSFLKDKETFNAFINKNINCGKLIC